MTIGDQTAWPADAIPMVEAFIAARGGVRVLEFGSGAGTLLLLARGARVVSVEERDAPAGSVRQVAADRGLAEALTIRSADAFDASLEEGRFDILLVSRRERADRLGDALALVKADGLVLLDEAQSDPDWAAARLLAAYECASFRDGAGSLSIWSLGQPAADPRFVTKRFDAARSASAPDRSRQLVPRDYLGAPLDPDYVRREPIRDLGPVETRLQDLRLIEREALYLSPSIYHLEGAALALRLGHKTLQYGGAIFRTKAGRFVPAEDREPVAGVIHLPGLTLDLTSSGAGRYSFFLLDLLPKLDLLAAAGHTIDDFDTILINTGAQWARAMLAQVLGPGRGNVTCFNSAQPSFTLERSVHLEGLRSARFTPAWIHGFVDRNFVAAAPTTGESFGPFVSISRQRASGRQILNHAAFLDLVVPLGFTEVFAEDHPPEELASRLRDARIVISPHGAGLANIILAPRDATVIELFSSHYTPQYFHLARDRGQDYRAVACVDAEGKSVFDRYTPATRNRAEFNRADLVAPIAELAAMLRPLVDEMRPIAPAAAAPVARPRRGAPVTDPAFAAEPAARGWSLRRLLGRE